MHFSESKFLRNSIKKPHQTQMKNKLSICTGASCFEMSIIKIPQFNPLFGAKNHCVQKQQHHHNIIQPQFFFRSYKKDNVYEKHDLLV